MRPRGRDGFVIAFVVFMLFAVSLASIAGYMIVGSEFELSRYSGQGAEALTVARAGLERFAAEQFGVVDDTVAYALGDGVVTIVARKVLTHDASTDLYFLRAEGTVSDPRMPASPARRVVGGYAYHHRRPIPGFAAVTVGADTVEVHGAAVGFDQDPSGACVDAGGPPSIGAIATMDVVQGATGELTGAPPSRTWPGGWAAIRDSIRVRWDVLSDPNFPVDHENALPTFSSLPADSFPVIRYTGSISPGWVGRGVLLVDGVFDPTEPFFWKGIVIAREVDDIIQGEIDGMLIAGLESPGIEGTVEVWTDVRYHSCAVGAANESLSYLELIRESVHEIH